MKIRILKAGNGDCLIISFIDATGVRRNILVDGGIDATYYSSTTNSYGELKNEIDRIRNGKEYIDLMVLTHIDNDHICGLLKWLELDAQAPDLIKNVWFNSGKLIAEHFNDTENPDLTVGLKIFRPSFTGVEEALDFEKYLLKAKIWERKIVCDEYALDDFGVKIEVLSPTKEQLNKLLKEYKEKTGDSAYTAAKENDWSIPIEDFIEEESSSTFKFKQDTSVKNGSSISFLLTANEKSILFLADSHPNGILKSLQRLKYSKDKPLKVDVLKVSHHGSKSNTSAKLLEIVDTDHYIISTNGTGHNHPNKRTIARIIKRNPNAIFHFNYDSIRNAIFSKEDKNKYKQVKAKVTTELEL